MFTSEIKLLPPLFNHPTLKHIIGLHPPSEIDLQNISYGASIDNLRIATDGSYFPETGAAAHSLVLTQGSGKQLCSSPGAPYGLDVNPLRAELLGILSVSTVHPLPGGHYIPYNTDRAIFRCDSSKAIQAALSPLRPRLGPAVQHHCDVLWRSLK